MTRAWVGLGSNLGDRRRQLIEAAEALDALSRTRVDRLSSIYETDPVGDPDQPRFLNAVARLGTGLDPRALLDALLAIERGAGRPLAGRARARTLDLDLLAHGDAVIDEPGLRVPHPRLEGRAFVLVPFAEIEPGWTHPVNGGTMELLLAGLGDHGGVRRIGRFELSGVGNQR